MISGRHVKSGVRGAPGELDVRVQSMRSIATVTVLGLVGVARAEDDPFAMLRERDREWSFELATGPSLGALAPRSCVRLGHHRW